MKSKLNKVIITLESGEEEEFEEVIAYNVANGMAQVVLPDGVMRVINYFKTMDVIPDEDSRARQLEMTRQAYKEETEVLPGETPPEEAPQEDPVH